MKTKAQIIQSLLEEKKITVEEAMTLMMRDNVGSNHCNLSHLSGCSCISSLSTTMEPSSALLSGYMQCWD